MKTAIEIILALYSILGVASSIVILKEAIRQRYVTTEQRLAVATSLIGSVFILIISVINLFI